MRARVATPQELGRFAATSRFRAGADPETTGMGPLITLRVVGVAAEVLPTDALPWMSMSRGFYETYRERVGLWFELTAIRLKRGDADLDAFRAGVERLAGGKQFTFYPYRGYTTKLKSTVDLQTQALLVLAVLGGLAVLVLVGQALARQAALESSEHPLLLSLGMTHRQLFALGMMRVAPVSLVAGALAVVVAVAAVTARTDRSRSDRGARSRSGTGSASWPAWAARRSVALVLLPALVAFPGGQHGRVPSAVIRALRQWWRTSQHEPGLSPSAVAGVRMTLEGPSRRQTAVPVRSTLLAAVAGVAAIAAALQAVAGERNRLLDTPRPVRARLGRGDRIRRQSDILRSGSSPGYAPIDRSRNSPVPSGELMGHRVTTACLAIGDQIRGSLAPPVLERRRRSRRRTRSSSATRPFAAPDGRASAIPSRGASAIGRQRSGLSAAAFA